VGFFTLQHGEELFLCAKGRSGFFSYCAHITASNWQRAAYLFVFPPSCRERHDYIYQFLMHPLSGHFVQATTQHTAKKPDDTETHFLFTFFSANVNYYLDVDIMKGFSAAVIANRQSIFYTGFEIHF
jgi:hypothetical protein